MIGICTKCRKEVLFYGKKSICGNCYTNLRRHQKIISGKISEEEYIRIKLNYKKWCLNNKEKLKIYSKRSYFKNKNKHRIRTSTNIIRNFILNLFDNKCSNCNSTINLEIDHLNYDKKITKKSNDIKQIINVLCRICHKKRHRLCYSN